MITYNPLFGGWFPGPELSAPKATYTFAAMLMSAHKRKYNQPTFLPTPLVSP